MARASARHILVDSQEQCEQLKQQIEGGEDFAEVAKQHSSCPSSRNGGDLGSFGKGAMVLEHSLRWHAFLRHILVGRRFNKSVAQGHGTDLERLPRATMSMAMHAEQRLGRCEWMSSNYNDR